MAAESNTKLPLWRRIRRRLYYWLLLAIIRLASGLNLKTGRWLGRSLARLAASLRPAECQRADSNIALAFPELDTASRKQIFNNSTTALGENFFDMLAVSKILGTDGLVREELTQGHVPLVDQLKQLNIGGQGVLILTGHLGCWELLGGWIARSMAEAGLGELAVVTGSIHNPPVDRLIQRRRKNLGMKVLPRDGGAAPLLRHLRGGGVAAVLLDQNTRVENLPIPFFGRNAPTPLGFARIALGGGIPVLPVVISKNGRGHLVRSSASWVAQDHEINHEQALPELLLWCNQQLEFYIRGNPAEWVWFHKRWTDPK